MFKWGTVLLNSLKDREYYSPHKETSVIMTSYLICLLRVLPNFSNFFFDYIKKQKLSVKVRIIDYYSPCLHAGENVIGLM